MWRLMRDWLAPSLSINSQTQCSPPSQRMRRAASRVGSASAERRATGSFMPPWNADQRICASPHSVAPAFSVAAGRRAAARRGLGAGPGFVARTKALKNFPSTCVASASTSRPWPARNSRASSTL